MEPVTERRWALRSELSSEAVTNLSSTLGLSRRLAELLVFRGITEAQEADHFLNGNLGQLPDPFLMKGMETAVRRLIQAVNGRERICIHGDYDVDGISAAALLTQGFSQLGLECDYHIPKRLSDGYGLSADALRQARQNGIALIVSVDCGVSAVEEARLAAELGLDLIITDHHLVPAQLPEATAVINPHQPGCPFPFKGLAGVGVAFFLLIALRKALRDQGGFEGREEPDIRALLDLVALGTIADVVPLRGLNRILVSRGLRLMDQAGRVGLAALCQVARVDTVSAASVGFRLAPRLNAAGRLEDAAVGVRLLLETRPDRAQSMAQELDRFNARRQEIEREVLEQAVQRIEMDYPSDAQSLVLADAQWHPGVVGIVASRLVERYNRPAVLIAVEGATGKGSGRSVRGVNLVEALRQSSNHLSAFGGHEVAAGLSLLADQVNGFRLAFEQAVRAQIPAGASPPEVKYDGLLSPDEVDEALIEDLLHLGPHGAGNPEPIFLFSSVRPQMIRRMGEKHLSFCLESACGQIRCVAFGKADRAKLLSAPVDLLATPEENRWRGQTQLQLRVRDFRPAR